MTRYLKTTLAAVVLATSALPAFAQQEIVIAPQCLINAANIHVNVLAQQNHLQLISLDEAALSRLSDAKHQTKKACGGFNNVTAEWLANKPQNNTAFLQAQLAVPATRTAAANYQIRYEKQVKQLLGQLNPTSMWSNLTTFSAFKDRYAGSATGVEAANWISEQIHTFAKNAGRDDVTVTFIQTPSWKQPSVLVKVGTGNDAGVVIGAHLDTTEANFFGDKPGADDDGSGSMTVLESARTIISSNMKFNHPIYFVWYAAEEKGLLGSKAVVSDFLKKNIPVSAVLHFDMTGYDYQNESTIWLMDDNTDNDLTTFLGKIITTYTTAAVKHTECGYMCSDHATWNNHHFKAALPAETRFDETNPVLHTPEDTIDKLSIKHMTDFAKVATAFAVEFAEPVN